MGRRHQVEVKCMKVSTSVHVKKVPFQLNHTERILCTPSGQERVFLWSYTLLRDW